MNLGPFTDYRLPSAIRSAYGVDTAGQLADQLGVSKQPTLALSGKADAAYAALKTGDQQPARALLVDDLGVSPERADAALAKLPPM